MLLDSQFSHHFLNGGVKACGTERRTRAAFSLLQGLNYDFRSSAEAREALEVVIHQLGCLYPPEQCVTPGPEEGRYRGDFHLYRHTHIDLNFTHAVTVTAGYIILLNVLIHISMPATTTITIELN